MDNESDFEPLTPGAGRSRRGVLVQVVMCLLCLCAPGARAQAMDSLEALQIRAQQFAQAISSGRAAELKGLVENSFGGNLANVPMATHIAVLMSYWDQSRGLSLVEVQEAQNYQGVVIFNSRLTRSVMPIGFQVEANPPHKIIGIRPVVVDSTAHLAQPLTEQDIVRELGTFMSRLADADTFSGTVLLARGDRVVFHRAYGVADKNFAVPAGRDTKYNVASMGKMFTAVAIAQLVERGKLSYEDRLAKFLPEFPNAESAQKILIKHLLSHSAGLGMWWGPRFSSSAKDQFRTVDDLVAWAATDEKAAAFEPGAKFQYSNTGYVLLGKVIEAVSGQSYSQYIRDNVFKPAGMTESVLSEREPINQHLAVGYQKSFDMDGQVLFRSNTHLQMSPMRGGPAGGDFSTALDLFKFSLALRAGKLLTRDSVALLTSPKTEFGSDRYGFGFDVSTQRHSAGHGGGSMGVSNNIEIFLDSGWTAIVLANYTVLGYEVSAPVVKKMRDLVGSTASRRPERTARP
jgi:CubicO group peptidase (beta-lactamase class C family)